MFSALSLPQFRAHPSPAHRSTPTWTAAAQPGDTACQEHHSAALVFVLPPKLKFIIALSQTCLLFHYGTLIYLKSDFDARIRRLSGTQCFTTQLSYEMWHLMNLQEHFTPTRNELLMQISQVLDTQQISQFLSISRLFNICPIYCSGLNNAGRAGQSQPCGILSSRKYC